MSEVRKALSCLEAQNPLDNGKDRVTNKKISAKTWPWEVTFPRYCFGRFDGVALNLFHSENSRHPLFRKFEMTFRELENPTDRIFLRI